MGVIKPYIHAIKKIKKKYYLTPFLLLIYAGVIMQLWQPVTRFISADKEAVDYVIFVISFFKAYVLVFILILFYPHATYLIQSTRLYQKIFGSAWGTIKSGFLTYTNIGKNIPDDYVIRGSRGTSYTISAGRKSKTERVHDANIIYIIYLIYKLFFKDLVLRVFTHLGTFFVSPILFLIAVPVLNKKGLLEYIEK